MKILMPTDFSANSRNALIYAVSLAQRLQASLTLIHIYNVPLIRPDHPEATAESIERKEVQRHKQQMLELINDHVPSGIESNHYIREGFVVDEILRVCKEVQADMIVMGTKGSSGLEEILLGSNTAKVIEQAKCPVLAVPESVAFKIINRIVYAADFEKGDYAVLQQLAKFAEHFNAEIDILHVNEDVGEISDVDIKVFAQKIKKSTQYDKISLQTVDNDDVIDGINYYLSNNKADMLAMLTHRKNLWERLFSSSITKKMAHHTKVPLLAFHA